MKWNGMDKNTKKLYVLAGCNKIAEAPLHIIGLETKNSEILHGVCENHIGFCLQIDRTHFG